MRNRGLEIIDEDIAKIVTSDLTHLPNGSFLGLGGKRVLVTGGTGILGTYILATLNALRGTPSEPDSVWFVSRKKPEENTPLDWITRNMNYVYCDLAGDLGYVRGLPMADVIIHAGGHGQPGKFMANKVDTLSINTSTTIALARLLRPGGKFLFCSSSEVYSGLKSNPVETDIGTTSPGHPRACYIEGKRCGEAICHAFNQTDKRDFKIARIALAYGPGTRKDDQRVINDFIRTAILSGYVSMRDAGTAFRRYCYVSDCVEMLFNILLHGQHTIYNVGGISNTTIRELAELICDLCGAELRIPQDKSDAGAPRQVSMDISRYDFEFLKRGFVSLRDGLRRTIEWQRNMYANFRSE